MSLKLNGVQTRVLLPFLFNSHSFSPQNSLLINKLGEILLWEIGKVHSLYKDEMRDDVQDFLFAESNYWKVPDATVNRWFKNGVDVHFKKELIGRLKCLGIELFLLPSYGVGLLSFNFTYGTKNDQIKNLSHYLLKDNSLTFNLPEREGLANSPSINVSLSERLGKAGGVFRLGELRELLLNSFATAELQQPYQKVSFFTTVRFNQLTDSVVNFGIGQISNQWQDLLFRLAHIEEETHPGSYKISNSRLNPHHWIAITNISTVHFLADQTLPKSKEKVSFDEERVPRIFNKYFIHHAVVIFQRLILQSFLQQANLISQREVDTRKCLRDLQPIRGKQLRFSVNGYFIETSSREVLNQYYHLTQQSLRVEETFRTTQQILHDVESGENVLFQQKFSNEMEKVVGKLEESAKTVAHVQTKVEWLEVFFASYYSSALAYYISSSANFKCPVINGLSFQALSVISWAILGGIIAFSSLTPHLFHKEQDKEQHQKKEITIRWQFKMFFVLSLWGIWLFIGSMWFSSGCPIK